MTKGMIESSILDLRSKLMAASRFEYNSYVVSFLVAAALGAHAIARAHSHNDYEQPRPLMDALEQGLMSVEADIYLVEGRLMVAHDPEDIRPDRTLESLYLRPLDAWVRRNGGRIFAGGEELQLLIDFKRQGSEVYPVLRKELKRYPALFRPNTAGTVVPVISGDRPVALIRADPQRWMAVDGREPELANGEPAWLFPLVSESWLRHFTWLGIGEMPADQRVKLRRMARQAHEQGRKIRFWAAPDTNAVRAELWRAGVDWIGTDKPAELAAWIKGRS